MKRKNVWYPGTITLLAALLFTLLVRFVDRAPAGDSRTEVGFSHLNEAVFSILGVHPLWYWVTQILGIAAILTAAAFAVLGLRQLIQRRSFAKVDRTILALGRLYVLTALLYVIFEHVTVNCRPILMPGDTLPEASFPSTHTLLACSIFGSALMVLDKVIPNPGLRDKLTALAVLLLLVTVLGRLLSGYHWFTDVIGGLLYSAALLLLFRAAAGGDQTSRGVPEE